jgi:thiamine biosynthesis lipoprotein
MVTPLEVVAVGFSAMASACTVCLAAADAQQAAQLAQAAIDEVRRIETAYSRYRPDSIVARINAAAGADWLEIDAETEHLLDYADTLHAASGALFDITSGVLRRVWDFRSARVPAAQELASVLAMVGWDQAQRRPGQFRLARAGMEIDFGGFGKEYAADRAAAILAALGVRHGYVNLGGDLHVIGPQPGGAAWMIGIQDPRDATRTAASIPVAAGALATSGDYERFFILDGRRYCHLLDPGSGQPVEHWRSVSVLAPLAIAAGSYATIAMLKGEAGLAFLDQSGLAYLAIDRHGHTHSKNLGSECPELLVR